MKDWRIIQRRRADELARQGYRLVANGNGLDEMVLKARRHTLPPGTIWLWAIQEAWAKQDERAASE